MMNPTPTFAESFCAQHGIQREQFVRIVFKQVLYPRTLLLTGFLQFLKCDYFAPDFDLIYGVEHLRRMREFKIEASRFNEHPANRGWLRRRLRLRVSTHLLQALIKETLPSSIRQEEKIGVVSVPFNPAYRSE